MSNASEKLKEINNLARTQRKELAAIVRHFSTLDATVETLEAINPERIVAYWTAPWGGAFRCTVANLQSFKDLQLVEVLAQLETAFDVEFTMRDDAQDNRKVFEAEIKWGKEGQKRTFDITVSAELAPESAVCHRVVVGEKTETTTTPIYKLVCDDGSMS